MAEDTKTKTTMLAGVMAEIDKAKRESVKAVVKTKVQELLKIKEAASNLADEIATELAKVGEKMEGLSSFLED